jgi:hypothetical protein
MTIKPPNLTTLAPYPLSHGINKLAGIYLSRVLLLEYRQKLLRLICMAVISVSLLIPTYVLGSL